MLFCQIPRQFRFDISTIIQSGSLSIDYNVFIDNGDGIYNKTTDNINVHTGNVVLDNVNDSYHSPVLGYEPYSYTKPQCDRALWVVISSPSIPNEIYARIENNCIPLAVKFLSFNATRKSDKVDLAWTTASEENNKGFFVERKYGNTEWANLGYLPSAASNGNSDELINYSYIDINSLTGVCLYRIKQVSLDNNITYSDVRTVKGVDQIDKVIVFPNPSHNGQLNIVLDNINSRANIKLINMNGSIVKEWNNVTTHQLNISNLASGIYTVRVWIKELNETVSVKVMVNK
ncbi:MAG: T9SS type A sorting domain-containing protein [Chitinophagaceae bacterium]|nr:T9SS type A sorting domain-containing protein [Chitinophagaceae bacterium]